MNKLTKKVKIKKYKLGGIFGSGAEGGGSGQGLAMASQAGSIAGGLLQSSKSGTAQDAGAGLSLASQTTGLGFMLGGPAGAAIVGGASLAFGAATNAKKRREEDARMQEEKEAREKAEAERRRIVDTAKLYAYDQDGDNSKAIYKYGGEIKGSMPEGGDTVPLSSDTSEIVGKTHEEGGVKFKNVELEDKETVKQLQQGGSFVFSDSLKVPNKNKSFAEEHKSISKVKGKIEQDMNTNKRSQNTLARLKQREKLLMQQQESMKGNVAPSEMMKYGGYTKSMRLGGPTEEEVGAFNNPNYRRPEGELFYPNGVDEYGTPYEQEQASPSTEMVKPTYGTGFNSLSTGEEVGKFNTTLKKGQGKLFYPNGAPGGEGEVGTGFNSMDTGEEVGEFSTSYKKPLGRKFNTSSASTSSRSPNLGQFNRSKGTSMNPNLSKLGEGFGSLSNYQGFNPTETQNESFNKDVLRNYDKEGPMATLARAGVDANNPLELQKALQKFNIDPDDFMNELESKGLNVGGRGFGKSNYGNIGKSTYKAYKNMNRGDDTENATEDANLGARGLVNDLPPTAEEQKESKKQDRKDKRGRNLGNFKKGALNTLGTAGRFIDNIKNAKLIREMENEKVPQEALNEPIKYKKLNYNDQKNQVDDAVSNATTVAKRLSNSNTAAQVASMNIASGIKAKGNISGKEERDNTNLTNKEKGVNANILASNNKTTLNNRLRELGARDDIRRTKSDNYKNLQEDVMSIVKDAKSEKLGNDGNLLYLSAGDQRKVKQLAKTNPQSLLDMGYTQKALSKILST